MAPPSESSPELVARRAASFGAEAAAYAAERPDYPETAIRWALEPVRMRTPLRVLDLAAGTGKLTQGLVRAGAEVVAVEPDEAMLAELRRLLPGVPALAGTAESIPLGDGAVDAILVGQAMHWFDLDRAMPEISRVLAPGGVLAGLWNTDDDRVPWVDGLKEVARSSVSYTRWEGHARLRPTPHFPELEEKSFPHAQRRTAESLVATLATHSHVLVLPDDEREKLMGRVLAYLRANPATTDGEFDMPLVTVTVRAVAQNRL
ncbi:class I SAM-dependent methyltransferase [Actinomadura sp. DC4]|uniref:class I SAM-dependent methyltransferase n=1 Tax=Actinomadura sp. DC4 TaxID=3055069 RepID=UPI0025B0A580|nr:class I SAM-dependent methyltransferase [Actinomadura sp. DC4]MDN3351656.1 class I SAM-dependent methyltransferase [Actinomadura sp. DC4]